MHKSNMSMEKTLYAMEKSFSAKNGLANSSSVSVSKNFLIRLTDSNITVGNVIPMYRTYAKNTGNNVSSIWRGGAVSLSPIRSKIKAYGEFIERYSSAYREDEFISEIIVDSYDNLTAQGRVCLDFRELLHFDDTLYGNLDFPLSKYNTCHPISWLKGKELVSGNNTLLPAQKVLLNYPFRKDELQYLWQLSTGLACGGNYIQAALSAIYETVERDSFMLTWLLQIPGTMIKPDKIRSNSLKELYFHIQKFMVGEDTLHIYDISKTDGIYTIMTYIRNDLPNAYGLIVACASHTNPEAALLKSLEELCQGHAFAYLNLFNNDNGNIQELKVEEVDSLDKHFFFYSNSHHNANIDFISSCNKSVALSELTDYSLQTNKETLEYIINVFRKCEQSVYVAEITKPEIKDIGFIIVKAIIPGYVDLDVNHNFRQTQYARLYHYKHILNTEINTHPHPFP